MIRAYPVDFSPAVGITLSEPEVMEAPYGENVLLFFRTHT